MKATNCFLLLAFLMFAGDGPVVVAQGPSMLNCINPVQMQNMTTNCLREFYLSFRTNPNADCPTTVRSMFPRCINHTLLNCFTANGLPPLPPGSMMNPLASFGNLNDTTAFCEYVVPIQVEPFTSCSADYYPALGLCAFSFKILFDANKGDPKLCKAYGVERDCIMKAAKAHCDPQEIKNYTAKFSFLSEEKYNPFCSDEQVAEFSGVSVASTLSNVSFLILSSFFILASVVVM